MLVISLAYSQIIEQFPAAAAATWSPRKLLGPSAGVVSGCALLVDYVLTITVSIAAGADAIFSASCRHDCVAAQAGGRGRRSSACWSC